MHTNNMERLTEKLPVQIEFGKACELIPELYDMAGTGLIAVQNTLVSRTEKFPPENLAASPKKEGMARILRAFLGENGRCHVKRFQSVIEGMHARDIAGVTVYPGVNACGQGTRVEEVETHLAGSARPVTVIAIDEKQKIRDFVRYLERMIDQGLVVLSDVEGVRYIHDFHLTDRRRRAR